MEGGGEPRKKSNLVHFHMYSSPHKFVSRVVCNQRTKNVHQVTEIFIDSRGFRSGKSYHARTGVSPGRGEAVPSFFLHFTYENVCIHIFGNLWKEIIIAINEYETHVLHQKKRSCTLGWAGKPGLWKSLLISWGMIHFVCRVAVTSLIASERLRFTSWAGRGGARRISCLGRDSFKVYYRYLI